MKQEKIIIQYCKKVPYIIFFSFKYSSSVTSGYSILDFMLLIFLSVSSLSAFVLSSFKPKEDQQGSDCTMDKLSTPTVTSHISSFHLSLTSICPALSKPHFLLLLLFVHSFGPVGKFFQCTSLGIM